MLQACLLRIICCSCLVALISILDSSSTCANTVTVYYDPVTGNVSFDTANSMSGEVLIYNLRIDPNQTILRLRPENHIRLTPSPLAISSAITVQESTFSNPMRGLLTIGDVLPAGLPENALIPLFSQPVGTIWFSPGLSMPIINSVDFIYGRPGREFDNRWDLVDPDTLEWASEARLIYRQGSGEVLLDTRGNNGGYIAGFYLRSTGGILHENFIPPWDSPSLIADYNRIDLLGDAIEPGLYNLGNIFDAGLTHNDYISKFTEAKFFLKAGLGDLDLETEGQAFSLIYVPIPEPATASLLALASILLLGNVRSPHRHI